MLEHLSQGQMRAGPIVLFHVTEQQVTEVALAEYNNVVKAFPSDRTDQPFSICVFSPLMCAASPTGVSSPRMAV